MIKPGAFVTWLTLYLPCSKYLLVALPNESVVNESTFSFFVLNTSNVILASGLLSPDWVESSSPFSPSACFVNEILPYSANSFVYTVGLSFFSKLISLSSTLSNVL